MSSDDANDLVEADSNLRNVGKLVGGMGFRVAAELIAHAIAFIHRQAAENAALKAEVERLTPRDMTLKEIAAVFNEHLIHDRDDWDADDCTVFRRHGDDRIEAGDATLMAQGLLRDAGPIVVQEPATLKEVNP
jgi:hypothetical protein